MIICFTLLGCGKQDATVSGKITYRSRALTRGEISFIAADGQSASGTIHADGCYQVTQVPQGEVTVIVSSVGGTKANPNSACKASRRRRSESR